MARLAVFCLLVVIAAVQAEIVGFNKVVRGTAIKGIILGINYRKLRANRPKVCMMKCTRINGLGVPCVAWKWKQNNRRYPKFMRKRCILMTTAQTDNPRKAKGWVWGTPTD